MIVVTVNFAVDMLYAALDPRITAEDKNSGSTSHSKAIIEAVRPFAWMDKFPPTSALTQEEVRGIERKWGATISGRASGKAPPIGKSKSRRKK